MKVKDKKTKQADSTKRICESQTRSEACACGACARGTTPAAKYETNKRDVMALIDFIAGCVENHPRHAFETARWGNVGDIAHVRGRLMEIAVGYAIGADNSEFLALFNERPATAVASRNGGACECAAPAPNGSPYPMDEQRFENMVQTITDQIMASAG
ncbi:MAG: hypothetical protein ACOC3G_08535 [Phycisphaeraceae bacterium]